MEIANGFVKSGLYKKVVVVSAEFMSSIIDYTDRSTCPIFGDGGTAVLVEPTTEDLGIMDSELHTDGVGLPYLILKSGGSVQPVTHETLEDRDQYIHQEGRTVFKYAVTSMADVSESMMKRNNLSHEDIDWLVPHQANMRIIEATAHRMNLDKSKVMINIHKYANTSSASVPLALADWERKLKKEDKLVMSAFGAGFTWGSMYIKWAYDGSDVEKSEQ